jgi:hypothetical protein
VYVQPVVAGEPAPAPTPVVRGDPARRTLGVEEFESLVMLVLATPAAPGTMVRP